MVGIHQRSAHFTDRTEPHGIGSVREINQRAGCAAVSRQLDLELRESEQFAGLRLRHDQTVAFHARNVYEKLRVHSKSEAVARALRDRIV